MAYVPRGRDYQSGVEMAAIDNAIVRYGNPDKYREWEWLELRRTIKRLALQLD